MKRKQGTLKNVITISGLDKRLLYVGIEFTKPGSKWLGARLFHAIGH